MSGGHFDYKQYSIETIADEVEALIRYNKDSETYSQETIDKFQEAVTILRKAQIYTQRIDWLVSGDDGEDTFHTRLLDDLTNISK